MNDKVLIIVGSDSDLAVIKAAVDFLGEMEVEYALHISSAHRLPEKTALLASTAEESGFGVIIAAAGGAAHLPGVIAALTPLPVIGVPISTPDLKGVDSLYSIVQMPSGVPVAAVGINGARNAAILSVEILGAGNKSRRDKIRSFKKNLALQVEMKDERLQKSGLEAFLK